jgi:hypothetical protein
LSATVSAEGVVTRSAGVALMLTTVAQATSSVWELKATRQIRVELGT